MVLSGVFSAIGGVLVYCLYLCWLRYWYWVWRMREVAVELSRPGIRAFVDLQPLYIRQEAFLEKEEAWHKRYHWCLLLMPIFLGLAAFCAVFYWTEEWPFWIHVPLSALSGALVLLGSGWLGYGPVRERFLPLEDVIMEEE